jgi:yecA family protein
MMKKPKLPQTVVGMSDKELDRWLQARQGMKPLASNLAMLDGVVTAMAAGPLDQDLVGAILAALALQPEDLNTGGTPEFMAIQATAERFNRISRELQNGVFVPHCQRRGDDDTGPYDWCEGFLAYVTLTRPEWDTVMTVTNPLHRLILPILKLRRDEQGRPNLEPPRPQPVGPQSAQDTWQEIQESVVEIRNHYHFVPKGQSRRR